METKGKVRSEKTTVMSGLQTMRQAVESKKSSDLEVIVRNEQLGKS